VCLRVGVCLCVGVCLLSLSLTLFGVFVDLHNLALMLGFKDRFPLCH
jgi:hypothetical protein